MPPLFFTITGKVIPTLLTLHFFSKDLNADLNPLLGTVKFYTAST